MSDKLNTLEALRLASLKAKGYTAEQIAELSSAMEDIINDINDSLKTCEAHVQSAHAPANAEENVIVSIQRNGQAIPPDNKVVNIEVPTKTSALENDSGYATTEDVEEMFILAFEVIRTNYNGFFKKLGDRFGKVAEWAERTMAQARNATATSTSAVSQSLS